MKLILAFERGPCGGKLFVLALASRGRNQDYTATASA